MSKSTTLKSIKWIGCTLLFVIISVGLLGIIIWNPLIGCVVTVGVFLTIVVGSIMRAYFFYDKSHPSTINENPLPGFQLKGSQNMLRCATAILAFLSFLTTAQGMKGFVFGTDWMAYIGSLAVQSILIVFSLLLCRFFVRTNQLQWPKYIKKIVNHLMIFFFCVSLIVSSTFSYVFISHNAYKYSWPNDSEVIIQTHLLDQTNKLKKENDTRGRSILDKLTNLANGELQNWSNEIATQTDAQLKTELKKLQFDKQNIKVANIDEATWLQTYPQYEEDINLLYNTYQTVYIPQYTNKADRYNKMVDTIDEWKNNPPEKEDINSMKKDIETLVKELEKAKEELEQNWVNSNMINDHRVFKGTYNVACDELISKLNTINHSLDILLDNYPETEDDEGTSDNPQKILSDIYLLGVDSDIDVAVAVDDLLARVTTLAMNISKNENYDSKTIKTIVELKDLLVNYSHHITLKNNIDIFCEKHLKMTYQVYSEDQDWVQQSEQDKFKTEITTQRATNPANTTTAPQIDTTSLIDTADYEIAESEWKHKRNEDFNIFFSYVKSLPNVPDHTLTDLEHELIDESSAIQRDLLGTTTDFEKAFIYFKYRFPVMAYFSAFIAIFFDLGSFLTGCFLYASDYFKETNKQIKDNS